MKPPYICLRCSRQLLRSQCQRRSSGFVSLGQLVGRKDDSRTALQEELPADGEPAATKAPSRKQRLTFAQRYREERKPKGVDKVLETLFVSNRRHVQASKNSHDPQISKTVPITIDQRLRELYNKIRRGTAPLHDIWRDCNSLLDERDGNLGDAVANGKDKRAVNAIITQLIR